MKAERALKGSRNFRPCSKPSCILYLGTLALSDYTCYVISTNEIYCQKMCFKVNDSFLTPRSNDKLNWNASEVKRPSPPLSYYPGIFPRGHRRVTFNSLLTTDTPLLVSLSSYNVGKDELRSPDTTLIWSD